MELALRPESAALLKPHLERLAEQVRASSLKVVDKPGGKHVREWDIEGEPLTVALS